MHDTKYTVQVDSISEQEWSKLLVQFDDANIYQTWAFGAESWGEKRLSHVVVRTGGEVTAIGQARIARVPLLNTGIAFFRWGPLWRRRGGPENCESFEQVISAITREYAQRRGLMVRLMPNVFSGEKYASVLQEQLTRGGIIQDANNPCYRTFRVDLSPDPSLLRKKLDQKWRNQLNAAERNGLTILQGSGPELFARFLAIYDEMMGRKQFDTSVNPRDFLRIQERLPDEQKMIILIAEKDGQPLNALIGSRQGDTGVYLLGATSNEGMKLKGAYVLQWRMMLALKDVGCRWYDLGGINPETNPGVYHFKKGLSGQEGTFIGQFQKSGSWISSVTVHAGEALRAGLRRFRSNGKRASGTAQPQPASA